MAAAMVDTALAYASCAARHAGTANAYDAARAQALEWNKEQH